MCHRPCPAALSTMHLKPPNPTIHSTMTRKMKLIKKLFQKLAFHHQWLHKGKPQWYGTLSLATLRFFHIYAFAHTWNFCLKCNCTFCYRSPQLQSHLRKQQHPNVQRSRPLQQQQQLHLQHR